MSTAGIPGALSNRRPESVPVVKRPTPKGSLIDAKLVSTYVLLYDITDI